MCILFSQNDADTPSPHYPSLSIPFLSVKKMCAIFKAGGAGRLPAIEDGDLSGGEGGGGGGSGGGGGGGGGDGDDHDRKEGKEDEGKKKKKRGKRGGKKGKGKGKR